MSKFKLAPRKSKETARYVCPFSTRDDAPPLVLIGRHAGRSNPAYTSALLKVMQGSGSSGGSVSIAKLDENDAAHIRLFSRHVLVGWENAIGDDDKPVTFSVEECLELLTQFCATDQYPEIIGAGGAMDRYFSNADNFRDEPVADAAALGKR